MNSTMRSAMARKKVIGTVVILIALPVLLAAFDAISFRVRNRNNGFMISSGEKREYLLYVPRSYDRTKPTPLVISLHGAGGSPTQQMYVSEWNRLADSHGFIVVYPAGVEGHGPRVWRVGPDFAKDVRFIAGMIDRLETAFNIDRSRIYANGFSNGGGMAFVLSCTMSDRIAAVGMVGAAQTLPWSWCTERRAVPLIAFHGTADRFAFYNGGQSWVAPAPFPAVPIWTASWARRNRCDPKPAESAVAFDVTRRAYTHCADDAAVVLYIVQGGGHSWPGGGPLPEWFVGPTTRSIDASNLMWSFFRDHPLHSR
jgi:polyhydroxybutyrate depolymerase